MAWLGRPMARPLYSSWGSNMKRYYIVFNEHGALHTRLPINATVHDPLPTGTVSVDGDLWLRTINEVDGAWMLSSDGKITKEPLPELKPDFSEVERQWRDVELESLNWLRERHRDEQDLAVSTTLTPEQFAQLLTYMQQLRDWPQSPDFPDHEQRPHRPDWIATPTQ